LLHRSLADVADPGQTLGFGEDYNEDLMSEMSRVTSGQFYDAQSPEQLPAIFAAELEGLQNLAVQNLRVRIKRLDFCERFALLGNYPMVPLPDGRHEIALGDLTGDEERIVCFALEVLPLPWVDGKPVASLEGEKLLEVEFQYDELQDQSVRSRTESRVVRIQATEGTRFAPMPWCGNRGIRLPFRTIELPTRLFAAL
jgi:hypothetical protein